MGNFRGNVSGRRDSIGLYSFLDKGLCGAEYSVMTAEISSEEAARALRDVEASRLRMRTVVRAHQGHYHLWLWGVIVAGQCLGTQFYGVRALGLPSLIAIGVGLILSCLIGFLQATQIRTRPDPRFVGVVLMILVFHLGIIPALVGWPRDPKVAYTYGILLWTQIYIVAGLWFDSYLLWLGLLSVVFALLGLLVFTAFFWFWCAFFVGGTLIASGFYVRYFWR